jgi:PAP2 superfamily
VTEAPPPLRRRQFLRLGAATAGALALGWRTPDLTRAGDVTRRAQPPDRIDATVATRWFDQALACIRTTPGFTPPVAARLLGHAGVALYESVVPGLPHHRSLAGQLDSLTAMPPPRGGIGHFHWDLVANSAMAGILRRMLPAGAPSIPDIAGLEQQLVGSLGVGTDPEDVQRSRSYGDAVADAVFQWSSTDGGHEAYLRNFPAGYVPPSGPGLWVPTPPGFQHALQPTWGRNRTMITGLLGMADATPPVPFSTDPSSAFFSEAREVHDTVEQLTDDQLAIARFWSDDPGQTATPAGHSISILSQVVAATGSDLAVAAEAYARLGIALSDAFVCCWHTKYTYNVLRPTTYVRAHIDPTWGDPLPLTTPPFPEHTSGHSVQSGAMATVLTTLFGPVAFTDRTHERRGMPSRTFASFDAAASEAAISRLYGGIHYRRAIEAGLDQGSAVGRAANSLQLRRR